MHHAAFYLVGTLSVFGLVWIGLQCFRHSTDECGVLFLVIAAIAWFVFGLLVYAPGI